MPAVQLLEPSGSFAANPRSGVGGAEEVLLSARGGVPSSEMDGVALDGTPRHADADGGSLLGGALTGSLVPTKVWPTRAARFSSARSYANCASDRPGSCAACKASCTSRFSNCSSPPSMTSTKCTPPSPRRHSASGCSPPPTMASSTVPTVPTVPTRCCVRRARRRAPARRGVGTVVRLTARSRDHVEVADCDEDEQARQEARHARGGLRPRQVVDGPGLRKYSSVEGGRRLWRRIRPTPQRARRARATAQAGRTDATAATACCPRRAAPRRRFSWRA